MDKNKKGITLIALVITIIVLLILAGITINLTIGQDGILSRAQEAGIKSAEAEAKQKLELALLDLQAEKVINKEYNENEYIDNYLTSKQMVVIGNVVLVDGWQFAIDRSVPKIGIALGKGEESADITITANVENATDYTKATLNIKVAYEGEISSIQINGQEETIPTKADGKYVIEKEILQNGTYTILAKDANDNYEIAVANITEISEDTLIRTSEELVAFRNRVNQGATYEGRTISLANDLDLSSVCGATICSWEPISKYEEEKNNYFKGTFNGNNHIIDNLYINTTNDYQGLFGYVQNATITGIVIGEKSSIIGNSNIGGIVGNIEDSTILNCGNNATITGNGTIIGGITARAVNSEIIGTYNKGDITGVGHVIGGIVGGLADSESDNVVKYSYNTGNITGAYYVGGINGYGGNYAKIYNSYNKGNITGTSMHEAGSVFVGGISSRLRSYGLVTYSYNLGTVTSTNTGMLLGGIVGQNISIDAISSGASTISYSYNSGDVTSKGLYTGGVCGQNGQYCYIKNCYIWSGITVKYNSTAATNTVGTSTNNYLGRTVGIAYSNTSTYISNVGELDTMPTVYKVVNGLNEGESSYWSNSDVNAPKLLWEK